MELLNMMVSQEELFLDILRAILENLEGYRSRSLVSNILEEVVVSGVMARVEANSMDNNMMEMEGLESRVLEVLTVRKTKQLEGEGRVHIMAKRMAMEAHWREKRCEMAR